MVCHQEWRSQGWWRCHPWWCQEVHSTGFYCQEHHLWSSDQRTVWSCECSGNVKTSLGLAWYVIKNGVPKAGEGVTLDDVKKFIQLDSTAKNIICGHLTKGQYGRVSALETSKLVWDWLSKVNEGVSTQRDQRISVLRNLFNRLKRNDN